MREPSIPSNVSAAFGAIPGERRRKPRARVTLRGRCLLADRREVICTVIDASPNAVALAVPQRGKIGEKVVVYFDDGGRVEGEVVRNIKNGFVIQLIGRSRAGDALAKIVADKYFSAKRGW